MATIKNETKPQTVNEILIKGLQIPEYQRPYKWQPKHVNQLIDDIFNHRAKSCYRLGTVVLYQNKGSEAGDEKSALNIVDGQQRLLTLTLLCTILDEEEKRISSSLLKHKFTSSVSIKNLKNNAQIISERVASLQASEKQELLDFVLNKCELIQVTLDDLSEAFQFFDSQNARGKELAPYDLLKAYHLREMMDSTKQTERLHHVSLWEQGVNPDDSSANLHTIMGEFLFRMRRWIDGDYGIQFSRHNIDVFKGINLDSTQYAYVESMLALDYAIETFNADPARKWDKQAKAYPFQVDQVMINGKRFFEYIQHYMAIHSILFVGKDARLFSFVETHAKYSGSNRKGDSYVRNLFLCAVMYYYDKFGDVELEKAAQICYRWAYYLRLYLQRIGMESVDNHAKARNGLFRVISKAIHPHQVLTYQPPYIESPNFNNPENVKNSIEAMKLGTLNESN
ncbi:DUF262 domain-containing protein [Vibrio parahaemolyticus]|uniref:DUF262 domain-containing protein n=1 Tax=Vibrio parahaemolyticus TaxID=670 RepID=UPI001B81F5A4|nr:DUF262 domain-containing protein [Vibrio parahaemolyticus]MDF4613041.1 DUF262 domain-containing protein [Vibrio parahaemolyticus]WOO27042.1 DUF262 domain-containing protein [Vibrio parahaemolyticus]HBC3480855.1 DUF262 domain-containing protein [Vibrio parahaemolyticus]HCE1510492.1 DUF262 domain-containing protein [Vibrio parahaemolyticus]HCE1954209.1 DUF262 domain-containing protein [Vibrio parahaemolyticus]